jgi:hypothetical protein
VGSRIWAARMGEGGRGAYLSGTHLVVPPWGDGVLCLCSLLKAALVLPSNSTLTSRWLRHYLEMVRGTFAWDAPSSVAEGLPMEGVLRLVGTCSITRLTSPAPAQVAT